MEFFRHHIFLLFFGGMLVVDSFIIIFACIVDVEFNIGTSIVAAGKILARLEICTIVPFPPSSKSELFP